MYLIIQCLLGIHASDLGKNLCIAAFFDFAFDIQQQLLQ